MKNVVFTLNLLKSVNQCFFSRNDLNNPTLSGEKFLPQYFELPWLTLFGNSSNSRTCPSWSDRAVMMHPVLTKSLLMLVKILSIQVFVVAVILLGKSIKCVSYVSKECVFF